MKSLSWKIPSLFAVAILIVVGAVLTLNADTFGKSKKEAFGTKRSATIKIQQAQPASSNLTLPPGPRTGRFYLNGSGSGFSNGVHDLGAIKRGQRITVFVEGLSTGFDPIVIVTAPNWARNDLIVWEADDNGNDPDPAFTITAPVSGVYTMLVAEYNQRPGWYRYRLEVE